jgi:hypothetical protein
MLSLVTFLLIAVPRIGPAGHTHAPVIQPETVAPGTPQSPRAVPSPDTAGRVGKSPSATRLRRDTTPPSAASAADNLCVEARAAIMQGMLTSNTRASRRKYVTAEDDARQALALSPKSLEARYWIAAAEGMRAGFGGLGHRLHLGEDVYHQAQSILAADPDNAGGHYLMGRLNIQVMTLNGLVRFIAGHLLGAKVIAQASWAKAVQNLSVAVKGDPRNAMYRLALARAYVDTHRDALARAQIQTLLHATDTTPITPLVDARARSLLQSLHPAR